MSDFKTDSQNILPTVAFKIFANEMIFYIASSDFRHAQSENIVAAGSKVEKCILQKITIDSLFGGSSEETAA